MSTEDSEEGTGPIEPGRPAGEVYDWYRRGMRLLEGGHAGAAAELLSHARDRVPESASVREALARALFDSGRHAEAAAAFGELVETNPGDDYARFGLGLSLVRLDRFTDAVEQLALAAAMRPSWECCCGIFRAGRCCCCARAICPRSRRRRWRGCWSSSVSRRCRNCRPSIACLPATTIRRRRGARAACCCVGTCVARRRRCAPATVSTWTRLTGPRRRGKGGAVRRLRARGPSTRGDSPAG